MLGLAAAIGYRGTLDSCSIHGTGTPVVRRLTMFANSLYRMSFMSTSTMHLLGIDPYDQIDNIRCLPAETGVIPLTELMHILTELGYEGPVTPEPFSEKVNGMEPHRCSESDCGIIGPSVGTRWAVGTVFDIGCSQVHASEDTCKHPLQKKPLASKKYPTNAWTLDVPFSRICCPRAPILLNLAWRKVGRKSYNLNNHLSMYPSLKTWAC